MSWEQVEKASHAPVAPKPVPKKVVAPQPKKTQTTAKKGIDAALDGLE